MNALSPGILLGATQGSGAPMGGTPSPPLPQGQIDAMARILASTPEDFNTQVARPWHSDLEQKQSRMLIQRAIFQLVLEQRPEATNEWLVNLIDVARHIECRLYYTADNFTEYWDSYTLLPRINSLVYSLVNEAEKSISPENQLQEVDEHGRFRYNGSVGMDGQEITDPLLRDAYESIAPTGCPQISSQGCSRVFVVKILLIISKFVRGKKLPSIFTFDKAILNKWIEEARTACCSVTYQEEEEYFGGPNFVYDNPSTHWIMPQQLFSWWKNNLERKFKMKILEEDASYTGHDPRRLTRARWCETIISLAKVIRSSASSTSTGQRFTTFVQLKDELTAAESSSSTNNNNDNNDITTIVVPSTNENKNKDDEVEVAIAVGSSSGNNNNNNNTSNDNASMELTHHHKEDTEDRLETLTTLNTLSGLLSTSILNTTIVTESDIEIKPSLSSGSGSGSSGSNGSSSTNMHRNIIPSHLNPSPYFQNSNRSTKMDDMSNQPLLTGGLTTFQINDTQLTNTTLPTSMTSISAAMLSNSISSYHPTNHHGHSHSHSSSKSTNSSSNMMPPPQRTTVYPHSSTTSMHMSSKPPLHPHHTNANTNNTMKIETLQLPVDSWLLHHFMNRYPHSYMKNAGFQQHLEAVIQYKELQEYISLGLMTVKGSNIKVVKNKEKSERKKKSENNTYDEDNVDNQDLENTKNNKKLSSKTTKKKKVSSKSSIKNKNKNRFEDNEEEGENDMNDNDINEGSYLDDDNDDINDEEPQEREQQRVKKTKLSSSSSSSTNKANKKSKTISERHNELNNEGIASSSNNNSSSNQVFNKMKKSKSSSSSSKNGNNISHYNDNTNISTNNSGASISMNKGSIHSLIEAIEWTHTDHDTLSYPPPPLSSTSTTGYKTNNNDNINDVEEDDDEGSSNNSSTDNHYEMNSNNSSINDRTTTTTNRKKTIKASDNNHSNNSQKKSSSSSNNKRKNMVSNEYNNMTTTTTTISNNVSNDQDIYKREYMTKKSRRDTNTNTMTNTTTANTMISLMSINTPSNLLTSSSLYDNNIILPKKIHEDVHIFLDLSYSNNMIQSYIDDDNDHNEVKVKATKLDSTDNRKNNQYIVSSTYQEQSCHMYMDFTDDSITKIPYQNSKNADVTTTSTTAATTSTISTNDIKSVQNTSGNTDALPITTKQSYPYHAVEFKYFGPLNSRIMTPTLLQELKWKTSQSNTLLFSPFTSIKSTSSSASASAIGTNTAMYSAERFSTTENIDQIFLNQDGSRKSPQIGDNYQAYILSSSSSIELLKVDPIQLTDESISMHHKATDNSNSENMPPISTDMYNIKLDNEYITRQHDFIHIGSIVIIQYYSQYDQQVQPSRQQSTVLPECVSTNKQRIRQKIGCITDIDDITYEVYDGHKYITVNKENVYDPYLVERLRDSHQYLNTYEMDVKWSYEEVEAFTSGIKKYGDYLKPVWEAMRQDKSLYSSHTQKVPKAWYQVVDFYHRIYYVGKQNGGIKRLLSVYEKADKLAEMEESDESEEDEEGEEQNTLPHYHTTDGKNATTISISQLMDSENKHNQSDHDSSSSRDDDEDSNEDDEENDDDEEDDDEVEFHDPHMMSFSDLNAEQRLQRQSHTHTHSHDHEHESSHSSSGSSSSSRGNHDHTHNHSMCSYQDCSYHHNNNITTHTTPVYSSHSEVHVADSYTHNHDHSHSHSHHHSHQNDIFSPPPPLSSSTHKVDITTSSANITEETDPSNTMEVQLSQSSQERDSVMSRQSTRIRSKAKNN